MLSTVFENIATNGGWESDGSTISGGGSTIHINEHRVKFLADFIEIYNITQLLDIPCGDCNWQHTIPNLDKIRYFGSDISPTALKLAKEKNAKRPHMVFSDNPMDLTCEVPTITNAKTTLIIIKEVIQHLTLKQGLSMLRNAQLSGAQFIAITNHDVKTFNVKKNIDIVPGEFYPNNIFLPPFNFKNPIRDIANSIGPKLNAGCGNLIIFNLQDQIINVDT